MGRLVTPCRVPYRRVVFAWPPCRTSQARSCAVVASIFGVGPMRRRQVLRTVGAALVLSPSLVHAQPLPMLRSFNLQRQDAGLRLRLALSTQLAYRSVSLSDPGRLVIDLPGVSTQPPQVDPLPDRLAVVAIRSGPHRDGLRVVLDLAQPLTATARWEDDLLVVDLAAVSGAFDPFAE